MNSILQGALAAAALALCAQASAQIVFYEHDGFAGQSFSAERSTDNFQPYGFNDRASSVVVLRDRWEVCEDAQFRGRCVVLRPGRYASLSAMGLNDRVSSARVVNTDARIDSGRYAPAPAPVYDDHRRGAERLYQADIVAVRAVVGPPEQRCWVEREQVAPTQSNLNVPAAIAGAVIGGVLGHQVGGGRGNDLATAAGAVGGAALGANLGRDAQQPQTQDVRRCASVANQSQPAYWDVTYLFRGQEHRMQTRAPPGATVTVNARGEPRA